MYDFTSYALNLIYKNFFFLLYYLFYFYLFFQWGWDLLKPTAKWGPQKAHLKELKRLKAEAESESSKVIGIENAAFEDERL